MMPFSVMFNTDTFFHCLMNLFFRNYAAPCLEQYFLKLQSITTPSAMTMLMENTKEDCKCISLSTETFNNDRPSGEKTKSPERPSGLEPMNVG